MKLFISTICLLTISISVFSQEIFGGVNFGTSNILWKSKKRKLFYNGLNLKLGINSGEGYKIGLGFKQVFGINYDEEYNQHNIGIESVIGLSYRAAAGYTEIARYGLALDMSMGIRFRLFQNYGAKISYNLSYRYFDRIENLNYEHGLTIGFVGPLWVNKKSIFKRRKALKILQGQ